MPVVAPIMKVENCKKFGANVLIHGANIGESRDRYNVEFSLCASTKQFGFFSLE